MKKILPLTVKPTINCFNDESFKYNIASQNKSYNDWLFSSYMHLCIESDENDFFGYLKGYHHWLYIIPELEENCIKRCFFNNVLTDLDVVECLIEALNNNYYCYLFLNEFYVENRWAYNKKEFIHDNLILGHDMEMKEFLIYGYGISKQLEISKISFDSFKKAFEALDSTHGGSDIVFLKPNECQFILEIGEYKSSIEKYLSGYVFDQNRPSHKYGMDIYAVLIEYFSREIEAFDVKRTHKLLEHKLWLRASLEFLMVDKEVSCLAEILPEVDKLISKASLLKSLVIKYNMVFAKYKTRDRKIQESIIECLYNLKETEMNCLNEIIVILE